MKNRSKVNRNNKLNKFKFAIVFIALSFLSVALILFINFRMITVELNGSKELSIEVFSEYNDAGFIVKKGKKEYKNYTEDIKCDVDTNVLGKYNCEYNIKVVGKSYNLKRIVNVIDSTKPVIEVNVDKLTKKYCDGTFAEEFSYIGTDNYDGNITDSIIVEETDSEYILKLTDSSNNETSISIPIVKESKPDSYISLNGSKNIQLTVGSTYNESGASIYDGCGKKMNYNINIEGSVNTNVVGSYTIKYTANVDGKILSATRTINVNNPSGKGKIVYLTFDDGPGGYTQSILNTLDKYGVKATFFVTNQFPKYQYLIGEEARRGHAVGIHTYSHKWSIYDSVDAYMNDFNAISDIIVSETGIKPYIFRFPGGSSNTVSKGHSIGIVSTLANKLVNEGYAYFDWNVGSGDSDGASVSKIISNVKSGMQSHNTSVVLMHDIKKNTASALDDILSYGVNNGYTFKTLNTSSYGAHHKIAN